MGVAPLARLYIFCLSDEQRKARENKLVQRIHEYKLKLPNIFEKIRINASFGRVSLVGNVDVFEQNYNIENITQYIPIYQTILNELLQLGLCDSYTCFNYKESIKFFYFLEKECWRRTLVADMYFAKLFLLYNQEILKQQYLPILLEKAPTKQNIMEYKQDVWESIIESCKKDSHFSFAIKS